MNISLQERLNWVAYILNISNKDIDIKEGDTYSQIMEHLIITRINKLYRLGILFNKTNENIVTDGIRDKGVSHDTISNGYILYTFNNILENSKSDLKTQKEYFKIKKSRYSYRTNRSKSYKKHS